MIHFDINNLEIELKNLEEQTTTEGFWNNQELSNNVVNKIKIIKNKCESFKKLEEERQNFFTKEPSLLKNYKKI